VERLKTENQKLRNQLEQRMMDGDDDFGDPAEGGRGLYGHDEHGLSAPSLTWSDYENIDEAQRAMLLEKAIDVLRVDSYDAQARHSQNRDRGRSNSRARRK
jgi:hypothetical protein